MEELWAEEVLSLGGATTRIQSPQSWEKSANYNTHIFLADVVLVLNKDSLLLLRSVSFHLKENIYQESFLSQTV